MDLVSVFNMGAHVFDFAFQAKDLIYVKWKGKPSLGSYGSQLALL